jgi:predicted nucleic acid-binding protein
VGSAYLDSSALVKLIRPEPETDALRRFLGDPWRPMMLSELGVTEVRRASRRVALDPTEALASCEIVRLTADVLEHAAGLDPPSLRTLDAIHLATALSLGSELDAFVAYDERLLAAAAQHGLPTAAPA